MDKDLPNVFACHNPIKHSTMKKHFYSDGNNQSEITDKPVIEYEILNEQVASEVEEYTLMNVNEKIKYLNSLPGYMEDVYLTVETNEYIYDGIFNADDNTHIYIQNEDETIGIKKSEIKSIDLAN